MEKEPEKLTWKRNQEIKPGNPTRKALVT